MSRVVIGALLVSSALLTLRQADAGTLDNFRRRPWRTIEQGARDAGRAIEKAAQDAGRAIEKAAHDTGRAIEKAAHDVGKAADQVAREFCRIMTLGGSETGKASCSINAGVGMSSNGGGVEPFVYDPANPDVRYPIGTRQLTLPSVQELEAANRLLAPAPEIEPWERRLNEKTAVFLQPGDRIGLPWVGAASETRIPTKTGQIRIGLGEFLSSRKDSRYPNGRRFHGGIDYLKKVNDPVYAHVSGTIISIYPPSEPGLLAIRIRTDRGYQGDLLYVTPSDDIRRKLDRKEEIHVRAGDVIGTAQDIHMLVPDTSRPGQTKRAYPENVPQHVHASLRDPQGRYVSPDGKTTIIMHRGEVPIVNTVPDGSALPTRSGQ